MVQLVLTAGVGLFLGLEREWSVKSAGIRTYSLSSHLGAVFTLIGRKARLVIGGAVAEPAFGAGGLYVAAALSGLVSSAGATTSAVVLLRAGTIDAVVATTAILLATIASIAVKAGLTLWVSERRFSVTVVGWSLALIVASGLGYLAVA